MDRINRNRNTVAIETPKSKFNAPTPGLEDVHFIHNNGKTSAGFGIVRSKLSRNIGSKDKSDMGSKPIEDMLHPTQKLSSQLNPFDHSQWKIITRWKN